MSRVHLLLSILLPLQRVSQPWLFHRLLHEWPYSSSGSSFTSFNLFSMLQTEWSIHFTLILIIFSGFLVHKYPSSHVLGDHLLNFTTLFPSTSLPAHFTPPNGTSLSLMNVINSLFCAFSYLLSDNYLFHASLTSYTS